MTGDAEPRKFKPEHRPELTRPVAVDRVGAGGLTIVVEATPDECAAVAKRLNIPAVEALRCDFTVRRGDDDARGEVIAEGELSAVVVRTCVVSSDDFPMDVREQFRVRFVCAGTESAEIDFEDDDEVPYEGGMIDLGEAAIEELALDLDPSPRKPGSTLPDIASDATPSPFAGLAARRQRN